MKTISDYRTETLVLLGDAAGRRYSETQLNTAIRQALSMLRKYLPNKDTIEKTVAAVNGREITLVWSPTPDAEILTIRNANGEVLTAADYRTGTRTYLQFYNSPMIPGVGDTLSLEIGLPHTIKNLDSATDTTVPDDLFLTVCTGAAGYALQIRARSVTEVFGKRPEDTERLLEEADRMIAQYSGDLRGLLDVFDPMPRGGFKP